MSKLDIVLDLGGSIVNGGTLDAEFLKSFREFIRDQVAKGVSLGIVVGGGAITRMYQDFLRANFPVDNNDLDMIGIRPTKVNAELIRIILKEWAYGSVVEDPTQELGEFNTKVVVFSGWKPGWSTDYVAVVVARRFGVKEVLSLSNIKGVYEVKDGVVQHGVLVPKLSWTDYEAMGPGQWTPGMKVPFDPVATKEAKEAGISVVVMEGSNIPNLVNYCAGNEFVGTVIS